ncbi:MAG: hypothetical protein CUN55_00595 [Phototrophicales bacterium]|nr:MAG: hypothetical protein CUN55_00595 [Phototrophicales bacterium]
MQRAKQRVVAAIIIASRKQYSQLYAFNAVCNMSHIERIYVNLQIDNCRDLSLFPLIQKIKNHPTADYDVWHVSSSWRVKPQYSQDQQRLKNIVTARNMAIDYAMARGATHLLFVDSDVAPEPDGVDKLLSLNANLCGGYVPGRGAHAHNRYVFGEVSRTPEGHIICAHGTCGYMMISRRVFQRIRFRYGPHPENPEILLSEDPAYCLDWKHISGENFIIHTGATATHIDDPENPLTPDQTARDNTSSIQI